MSDPVLDKLEALIQRDAVGRGLARDLADNLFTRTRGELAAACRSLAEALAGGRLHAALVTGFWIPQAHAYETDGPLGTIFLARAIHALGGRVAVLAEEGCLAAIERAAELCCLPLAPLEELVPTHLVAIERVGPSHTPESIGRLCADSMPAFLAQVPAHEYDRCHSMRGLDVTAQTLPLHRLFEDSGGAVRLGIGDGGNEIGMGKLPWSVIARNVSNGGIVACRVPVDHLIVAGVSNWGAYALAAGLWHLAGKSRAAAFFDPDAERDLWQSVLAEVRLVDGVTGLSTLSVDGLNWDEYIQPLSEMRRLWR